MIASLALLGLALEPSQAMPNQYEMCAKQIESLASAWTIPSDLSAILDKIRAANPGVPFSTMGQPDEEFEQKFLGSEYPKGCDEFLKQISLSSKNAQCMATLMSESDELLSKFWASSDLLDRVMGASSVCMHMSEQ